MEKDIGKIAKNDQTEIIVRIDDFGGKTGLTIREFTTSERYTGFTKSGTRIPADKVEEFKKIINSIDPADLSIPEASTDDAPKETTASSDSTLPEEETSEETSNSEDDY